MCRQISVAAPSALAPPAATVIADWVSRFEPSDEHAVLGAGIRALVDVVGCALAGSAHPVTEMIVKDVAANYGPGNCLQIDGRRGSPLAAALVNGVAAHVLDYDDTCFEGIVHASAVVWPAVHAAAEISGATGRDYLTSLVVGIESECALGRALGSSLYERGWWNTGLLGSIGAAAGAARALGLGTTECGNAIAIAAATGGGQRSILGYSAKPIGCGLAARAGLEAALLARSGVEAPADAFESPRGFAAITNGGMFDASTLSLLGERFALLTPGFAFKAYPACSAAQAAIEATLILREKHEIIADDVDLVECQVTPLVAKSLVYQRPQTPAQAQFSLNFLVAQALVYGRVEAENIMPGSWTDPRIITSMEKVRMIERADLAVTAADRMERPEAAIVTVYRRDSPPLQHCVPAATGMPTNPMTDSALDAKFIGSARKCLSETDASQLLLGLRSIHSASDWNSVFEAALTGKGNASTSEASAPSGSSWS